MPTTLVTWNLKGSDDPDTGWVVDHLRRQGADLVALQEVQYLQARRIARGLGARSWRWGFKHWPLRTWPEGMAVIGVTRRVRVRTRALSHAGRLWSWRRRILQVAVVAGEPAPQEEPEGEAASGPTAGAADRGIGSGRAAVRTLVNVHLSPHGDGAARRADEVDTVLAEVWRVDPPVVLCGDLNERPGGDVHRRMAAAGLRDTTPGDAAGPPPDAPPPGGADPFPTNWQGWQRGTTAPPTQQLDYVYVPGGVVPRAVTVPRWGEPGFERFAALSDHLPVTAVLARG